MNPARFRWSLTAIVALLALPALLQARFSPADDLAEAKAYLAKFLSPDADRAALTAALRASESDYLAVFNDPDFARKLKTMHDQMLWDSPNAIIGPKEGQTELLAWAATGKQLREGTGDADEFPGGYKQVADKFNDDVTIVRWKFVAPGESTGMAFDGLVKISGHWRFMPKPWRAAE